MEDADEMKYFNFKNYTIEYEIFGRGKSVLLAFHGFGQKASQFRILEKSLGAYYQIFSINLFYHGNSSISENPIKDYFDKSDLRELLEAFVKKHEIETYSLAGYSLGGKIALCCLEILPERIEAMYLFAPDGLKVNPWYFATSHTQLGRNLYQKIVENPKLFLSVLQGLSNMRLLSKKMHSFITYHMENKEIRKLVYDVWILFRHLNPDLQKIKEILGRYPIEMHLFFGAYDVIIPAKTGKKFVKKIQNTDSLHIVPLGHKLIAEEMNGILMDILKNKKDAQ